MSGTEYTVAMIFDDKFFVPACTTIVSLLENKRDMITYNINVLTTGLSPDNCDVLKQCSKKYNSPINIIVQSADRYQQIYRQYDGNTGAGSIIALLKFDIWNVIPADLILYLDSDLIIQDDISELFNYSFDEGIFAAVVEDSGTLYNQTGVRSKVKSYFNSGVMLLNAKALRDNNLTLHLQKIKADLEDNRLVDQDAFNIGFDNHILTLPISYNCLAVNLFNSAGKYDIRELNKKYDTNYSCVFDLVDNSKIIHYASKEKPWLFADSPFVKKWDKYHAKTPNYSSLSRKRLDGHSIKEIPIMLATDENYTPQTGITILSALENRVSEVKYSFYIFTSNVFSKDTVDKFDRIVSSYPSCSITYMKMDDDLFSDVKLNISHITHPTFYRLVAGSKLPMFDKIIYLDSDVIVEQDLVEYFSTDLTGYYIAGVKGASYHWPADGNKKYCADNGLPSIDQYVNAGVLIFNLKEIRDDDVESEFVQLSKLGLRSQDQDVINRACYNKIRHLPYKYNCMVAKYESAPEQLLKVFTRDEINQANNCPVITHYAAEKKPWADLSCPLSDRWWYFAKMSPYYCEMIEKFGSKLICAGKENRFSRADCSIKSYNYIPVIGNFSEHFLFRYIKKIINKIRGHNNMNNVDYKSLDAMWKSGDEIQYKKLFSTCRDLIKTNDPQILGRLARLYRDGKGTEKDLEKALVLMRIAALRGISWASAEYVDILVMCDDPLYNVEAFSYCLKNANDDNPAIECRLARLYYRGIGTSKNLEKSIGWMSRAINYNKGWVDEYIGYLLSSKKSEHLDEAYRVAIIYSESDPKIQYRLAHMYKAGIGVKQDLNQAEAYLLKSADAGFKKAIDELKSIQS